MTVRASMAVSSSSAAEAMKARIDLYGKENQRAGETQIVRGVF